MENKFSACAHDIFELVFGLYVKSSCSRITVRLFSERSKVSPSDVLIEGNYSIHPLHSLKFFPLSLL